MTITVPWAWCEAAIGIGACIVAGTILGVIVQLLRGDGQ